MAFVKKVFLPAKKGCPKSFGYTDEEGQYYVILPEQKPVEITDEALYDKLIGAGLQDPSPKKKAKKPATT